ncbi:unnamed protein product [Periconia digitata]|uniref:Cytochrome P450 n=1 Tax=Periconia digitata TaxID=1303443 RepID=A0A9W4UNP6_9PLEO|nr:unnamed protein product [Periconia digitata]
MGLLSQFETESGPASHGYLLRIITAVPAFLLLRFIVSFTYNIYFHPLRKFPGSRLAAGTSLIHSYHHITGNEVTWTHREHEKYGDVVRLSPDSLSYINPEAWKDINGHRTGGRKENLKDDRFYQLEYNGQRNLATEGDPNEHRRVRKIFSNAFSDKALRLQEDMIRGHVNKLVRNIKEGITNDPAARLDIVKLYNCTTFDIMGYLTFGQSLGMLESSELTPWVKTVFASMKSGSIAHRLGSEYPIIGYLMKNFMPESVREMQRAHFEHTVQRVDLRLEDDGNQKHPDIWSLVLNNGDEQLTVPKMHANAAMFMVAGTETTATLLSGLTFLLLKNPDKMKKAIDEVRALALEDLNLENLPRLSYMNACFEEGLRCYPPVPNGLPRVVPKGGNAICGEWIPERTRVYVSSKAAFNSSSNFKDPESFVPERWLPNTGYGTDRKDVFQPFSHGPRNCLGKNLAYHEMRIILATVLWHFDLELCEESNSWSDQKSYILWEKPELMVKARAVR